MTYLFPCVEHINTTESESYSNYNAWSFILPAIHSEIIKLSSLSTEIHKPKMCDVNNIHNKWLFDNHVLNTNWIRTKLNLLMSTYWMTKARYFMQQYFSINDSFFLALWNVFVVADHAGQQQHLIIRKIYHGIFLVIILKFISENYMSLSNDVYYETKAKASPHVVYVVILAFLFRIPIQ